MRNMWDLVISLIHSLTTSNFESNLKIQKKEKVSDGITMLRQRHCIGKRKIMTASLSFFDLYQTKKLKKFYTICIAVLVEPINPVQSCTTVFNEWLTTGQLWYGMLWSSQYAILLANLMLTSSTDAPEALDPRVASWPGNGCNRTDQSAIIKWTPLWSSPVTDYFSKWAEAVALSEVVSAVLNFLRTKILSIFGVPKGLHPW